MMYRYMTLSDGTEIAHSEMKDNDRVKVYIEKPVYGGFHHATCWLPDYEWQDIVGFTEEEQSRLKEFVEANAHLIIEFSREGGFDNASNL